MWLDIAKISHGAQLILLPLFCVLALPPNLLVWWRAARVERSKPWMLPGGCCWNRDKHGSIPASALQSGSSSLSIQPQRPKVGVGVLVVSGSSVLLGKRRGSAGAGTWATPGGHLEFGESWAQCAVREVQEETGLTVTDVRLGMVLNVVDEPTGYRMPHRARTPD